VKRVLWTMMNKGWSAWISGHGRRRGGGRAVAQRQRRNFEEGLTFTFVFDVALWRRYDFLNLSYFFLTRGVQTNNTFILTQSAPNTIATSSKQNISANIKQTQQLWSNFIDCSRRRVQSSMHIRCRGSLFVLARLPTSVWYWIFWVLNPNRVIHVFTNLNMTNYLGYP
jgi:hypothetical protein